MAMAMAVAMVSDFGTMARYGVRWGGGQSMTGAGSERGNHPRVGGTTRQTGDGSRHGDEAGD